MGNGGVNGKKKETGVGLPKGYKNMYGVQESCVLDKVEAGECVCESTKD